MICIYGDWIRYRFNDGIRYGEIISTMNGIPPKLKTSTYYNVMNNCNVNSVYLEDILLKFNKSDFDAQ